MAVTLILPTKLNVEAAWQRYIALLHDLQSNPSLEADPAHSAQLEAAEAEWSSLFKRWSLIDSAATRKSA